MTSRVSVTDVTVRTIKPLEEKDHVKIIRPNFEDLWTSDIFLPAFFAYRLRDNSDGEYQKFALRLRNSLAKVLVPFFPYAGRWVSDGGTWTLDGTSGHKLVCDDSGVPFIEAYVDKDIDAVVRAGGGFQATPELNGYETLGLDSSSITQKMRLEGLPPVFVQLTRFRCGGVTLAVTFSHIHCDGQAFNDFMSSWAEVSRTGKITIVPRVDRESGVTFEKVYSQLNDGRFKTLSNLLEMKSPFGSSESSTMRLYEVNVATVENLKKSAKAKSGERQYVSTNDCIAAQLWKFTSSVPASISEGMPALVVQLAEARDKIYDPPLTHLVGNVFFPTICPMPPGSEILKEPLDSLALKIRTNLIQTDWRNIYNLEALTFLLQGFSGEYVNLWLNSSWTKFGVYGLDFGVAGPPYFAPGINASFDWGLLGMSFVTPPVPGNASSAATVSILGTPEVLDNLETLPDFWKFFLPWEQPTQSSDAKGSLVTQNF